MRTLGFWLTVIAGAVIVLALVVFLITPLVKLNRNQITAENENPCWSVNDQTFQCRQYQFDQCLQSETFTRDECIALVGGGRP